MDCINNRLDLLETHVDAANDARIGHVGRKVQIFWRKCYSTEAEVPVEQTVYQRVLLC